MKVLLVGGGGREHALAWKLSQSPLCTRLFAAPGNPGIEAVADRVALQPADLAGLARFAREEAIDLTVVGPEAPLCAGLADAFAKEGLPVFGPGRRGARLEGSKTFAKSLMRRHRIPTAQAQVVTNLQEAEAQLDAAETYPLVVKASGLAAGKGVRVCADRDEAMEFFRDLMIRRVFGDAGTEALLEEALVGREVSLLALTDGRTILPLEPCQDHKRALDGDRGPNTGGMGAFSPVSFVTGRLRNQIESQVLLPIVHALRREGIDYRGVLYAGLMITDGGPKVLEFNVRFGDPETQPLLLRLQSDLLEILLAVSEGRLEEVAPPVWDTRSSLCVVLAARGYPGSVEKGARIEGLDHVAAGEELQVFHAGTGRDAAGHLVTSGGRVLGVTALGETLEAARNRAYDAVRRIHWPGIHWRSDIGIKRFEEAPPRVAGEGGGTEGETGEGFTPPARHSP